jgi:hypothetical protein
MTQRRFNKQNITFTLKIVTIFKFYNTVEGSALLAAMSNWRFSVMGPGIEGRTLSLFLDEINSPHMEITIVSKCHSMVYKLHWPIKISFSYK